MFIPDFIALLVGVFLPAVKTWKALKSRRPSSLVWLSKYWLVLALCYCAEAVVIDTLCLRSVLPGYAIARLAGVLYLRCGGYDHVYKKYIDPFLIRYEPSGEKLLNLFITVFPPMIAKLLSVNGGGGSTSETAGDDHGEGGDGARKIPRRHTTPNDENDE